MFSLGLSLPTIAGQGRVTPWYRVPAHLLDGVAPGVVADVLNGRHALAGVGGRALSDIFANANASTACTRIDSSGRLVACAAGELRVDWTSGVPELLAEGPSANLCLQSADPTDAAKWTTTNATRVSGISDPAGGTAATRVTCNSTNNFANLGTSSSATSFTAGTTYVLSAFVRAGATSLVQLTGTSSVFGSTQYADFDLSTGAVTSSSGCTPRITKIGSEGWYRLEVAVVATAGASSVTGLILLFVPSATAPRLSVVTSTTMSFDVAFPQVEVGSVATSWISTAAAAVTRTADLIQLTTTAADVLRGSGAAVAWRGSAATSATGRILLGDVSGAKLLGSDATTASTLVSQVHTIASSALPGSVGACLGWGASGTIGADLGSTPTTSSSLTTTPTRVFVGPSGGLVAGQILRLRQLVGWSLADRPSSAGAQAQARSAA